MTSPKQSLYERLGGEAAIEAMVNNLYARVLADDELRHFFENTSMDKQRAMQLEFLCAALDGPVTYSGKPLTHVHQGRGITTRHFSIFVQHFIDTLRALGVSGEDADEVISRLNTRANEITGISY
jgi:hemoglobin